MAPYAAIAAAIAALNPVPAAASCADFATPQSLAEAIHTDGGLVFEGVVRQHWFTTSLVEVQRTWQGRPPSRFVAAGPCSGDECRIRDLIVGKSYVFWVSPDAGPMYSFGCDRPFEADPSLIALLGPSADAPAFGPVDLLVMASFVWWSAYVLVTPALGAVVIGILARLTRRRSTN